VEYGAYNDRGLKTDYDMIVVGWDVEPWDPDDYYYNCWHPGGSVYPFLGGAYNNQTVFDLLDKARLEPTLDGRLKLYRDAETLMQSDAAGIFSYRLSLGYAWRTAFKGFNMAIRGDWAFRSGGIHALKRV
jgi:ABC-type oligopeptide transport system substrate-binding subunit